MTPANPARVPIHRVASTVSFRNTRAITSVNRGMVKLSVVTTAMGAAARPLQYSAMPHASNTERATCSGTRSVLNESIPDRNITGSMVSVANAKRRNTT